MKQTHTLFSLVFGNDFVGLVSTISGSQAVSPFLLYQIKYKEDTEENSINLYSLLPETAETQFAKQMSEMQSEVNVCLKSPNINMG